MADGNRPINAEIAANESANLRKEFYDGLETYQSEAAEDRKLMRDEASKDRKVMQDTLEEIKQLRKDTDKIPGGYLKQWRKFGTLKVSLQIAIIWPKCSNFSNLSIVFVIVNTNYYDKKMFYPDVNIVMNINHIQLKLNSKLCLKPSFYIWQAMTDK